MKYPRIKQFGMEVTDGTPAYVSWESLEVLKSMGLAEKFDEYFGVQTCCAGGLYPHDVEAVLERLVSGKLTGTQLFWD